MKLTARAHISSFSRKTALACALTALPLISFAAEDLAADEDGTYKTAIVTSAEECTALCVEDTGLCRGSMLLEEITIYNGTRKSVMQCRLNNGLSATSPFEVTPPVPLDLNVAVAELNAYRIENGLNALTLDDKLNRASEVHAQDLAAHGIAAHEGTDGSTHGERVQRQGYYFSSAGENVATGQKSWDAVFQAWKDSPGHNKNLLAEGVTHFGIALVYEPTTTFATYWTMLVAAPLPSFAHPAAAITPKQKAMLDADMIAAE